MVNPKDMNELVKVAQQMQENFKKAHEALQRAEYTGEAGAGMVKVIKNGRHYTLKIDISDEAKAMGNIELGELIAAACNAATKKIDEASEKSMVNLSKELGLPDTTEGREE
ncbi:MAG: YbaB/EbfC family nucleoid-associated protein [Pseudomonadota bacterium]|nr:YbaB/EbfC family nucleoid-associated protein [Pseudomonadota bacterium]